MDLTYPNELADVALLVEGKKFYTSAYLMAIMSPVLKEMIMENRDKNKLLEITMDDVSPNQMEAILHWILRMNVQVDGYLLSRVAYRLGMTRLMEQCQEHIIQSWKTSSKNCLSALHIAQDCQLSKLRDDIVEYLSDMGDDDFIKVMNMEGFEHVERQICVDIMLLRTQKSHKQELLRSVGVNLVVADSRIPVCRSILGAASPVFKAMFESGMKESGATDIKLPGKKPDVVTFMVDFITPSQEFKPIPDNILQDLIILADEYQIERLRNACREKIISSLKGFSNEKKLELLLMSEHYNLPMVQEHVSKDLGRLDVDLGKIMTSVDFGNNAINALLRERVTCLETLVKVDLQKDWAEKMSKQCNNCNQNMSSFWCSRCGGNRPPHTNIDCEIPAKYNISPIFVKLSEPKVNFQVTGPLRSVDLFRGYGYSHYTFN